MQCSSCGTQLPVGVAYCTTCGVATPYNVSDSRVSPYDPTLVSSPPSAPQYKPATDYGSPPYGVPPQNPYEPLNSYAVPPQAPPPPPSRRPSVGLIALIVGLILLLIAGSGVIYYATVFRPNQLHAQANSTAEAQSTATMHAQQAATSQAQQATATAFANTPQGIYNRATSGRPVLDDPLSQNDTNNWYEGTGNPSCTFTGGAYHASDQTKNNTLYCAASSTNFSNFVYQIRMTIVKGDFGGIFFRFNIAKFKGYQFNIGQDGKYSLYLSVDSTGTYDQLLRSGSSSFFKTGLNQTNLIAIVASGSNIYLYVNKQYVTSASDSTYNSGQIGVLAGDTTVPTEVMFRNAQVWNV